VNLNNVIQEFDNGTRNENRLPLAVIPKGMSFEYVSNRTANPGDVVLADQLGGSIYVYDESGGDRTDLLTGFDGVSAVALLHQETAQDTYVDYLFFTVQSENTLYIYDLEGSEEPSPITNQDIDDVFEESGDFFESPVAIAVSADSDEALIFVLNEDETGKGSVRRLHVNPGTQGLVSGKTIGTKNVSSRPLIDIAYLEDTDALFVSKKSFGEESANGWVYRIANASDRTGSVDLDSVSPYIEALRSLTGLAIAPTNKEGTTADLLVLREIEGSVEQYDTLVAGDVEAVSFFGALSQFPQALAYDCTNERLVITDVPFNLTIARRFFEAFFTP
jgi:hypothetical protein